MFGPRAEVIAEFHTASPPANQVVDTEAVLALLRRRPCTIRDLSVGLSLHIGEAVKLVERLLKEGKLASFRRPDGVFFRAVGARGGIAHD